MEQYNMADSVRLPSEKKTVTATETELHEFDTQSRDHVLPNLQNTPAPMSAWPSQPVTLVPGKRLQMWLSAYDAILMLMSVLLMAKIILCIVAFYIDRHNTGSEIDEVSGLSIWLVNLDSQLVTLFTIVFVTIITTFVRRYALWKAQTGAYISELEQLQGSTSLPSTFKLIFSLRSFGRTSAILVFVWSFYYLGSQAAKSEYRLTNSSRYQNWDATVQMSNSPSYFSANADSFRQWEGYDMSTIAFQINAQFATDMIMPQNSNQATTPGTQDGPIIPDMAWTSAPKKINLFDWIRYRRQGWINVAKQSENIFTSLVGSGPMGILQQYPNNKTAENQWWTDSNPVLGTYTVTNTSYLAVSCAPPDLLPLSAFPARGLSDNSTVTFNMTGVRADAPRDTQGNPLREFEYWSRLEFSYTDATGSPISVNGSNSTYLSLKSVCNVTAVRVDMQVNCVTSGCFPKRIRYHDHWSSARATSYSTPFDDDAFAIPFWTNLMTSTGQTTDFTRPSYVQSSYLSFYWPGPQFQTLVGATPSVTPGYFGPLYTPAFGYGLFNDSSAIVDWMKLNVNLYLTQAVNTYYAQAQQQLFMYSLDYPLQDLVVKKRSDGVYSYVRLQGAFFVPQYRLYPEWVVLDTLSCLILLAAAIGSYWLRMHTLAPDIFGYVSSLTRDNPHVALPENGTTLDGIQRARLLKHIKVRIGDLRDDTGAEVGRVGLARVDGGAVHIDDLRRERTYL